MRPLAVIGHLTRDLVVDGPPRIGGGPWYAGRALRLLGKRARIAAKCGQADRGPYLARLAALGLPVSIATGGETTSFAIRYEADQRHMRVEAVGEPWRPDEAVEAIGDAEWVHVAALLRSDFPPETLAALGRGRRLLLDAQGLVRVPRVGPLALDAGFDREMLRHISVLKLAEEEAAALVGTPDEDALVSLGVPEILLTLGSAGCAVFAAGRFEHVPARMVGGEVDPTGAGDAFAVSYLSARSEGHAPASAARRAAALVSGLLAGRTG